MLDARSLLRVGFALALGGLLLGCSAASRELRDAPSATAHSAPAPGPPPCTPPSTFASVPAGVGSASAPLGLGDAIAQAARCNPKLAAARERWLAARERPAQARALPDPLLLYTEMLEPIQTRGGPIQRDFQIQQRIPAPGKLSAAGAIATENARVSRLEYEIVLRDTVAEVKVTYGELLYLRHALAIVSENQAIARQLSEKAAAEYGGATSEGPDPVTLFDSVKAQSQLAQLSYDTITLSELRVTEEARLNELLHRTAGASVGPLRELAYRPLNATREQLICLGRARRQELDAALHKIKAAEHAQRLARLARVPDFTLGMKYWMVDQDSSLGPGSGDDAVGVTLGVTLPIWAGKNRARIAEAEHLRRAACLDRQSQLDDLSSRITKVYFRLENADRLVRLYRDSLIPQAEDAMRIAESWHDTGRDTFGRLLEAQSVRLNFQLAYHRALADHEQMVTRLEQLVGTSLAHVRREDQP